MISILKDKQRITMLTINILTSNTSDPFSRIPSHEKVQAQINNYIINQMNEIKLSHKHEFYLIYDS